MVDMGAIGGIAASLNTAVNILKAAIDLRDAALAQGEIIELQRVIMDAQTSVFTANAERAALVERVSQLEKEMARLKAWDTEKQRYHLREVTPGSFAYSLKPETAGAEPPHWICATCYENDKKSILQIGGEPGRATRPYRCPQCKHEILVNLGWWGANAHPQSSP